MMNWYEELGRVTDSEDNMIALTGMETEEA